MLLLGGAYHGALEANFKYKKEKKEDLPLSDVLDAYDTCWEKRAAPAEDEETVEEIDWEDEDPGELKDKGAQLVKTYHRDVAPEIYPKEVELKLTRDAARKVPFVGYVDLIDENGLVIDHKTSKRSKNADEANRDIQPSAYAYLMNKPINFEFQVAVKKVDPVIQKVPTKRTRADIEWYYDMVELVLKQMKRGIAPPNPTSFLCSPKWCGYWNLCHGEVVRHWNVAHAAQKKANRRLKSIRAIDEQLQRLQPGYRYLPAHPNVLDKPMLCNSEGREEYLEYVNVREMQRRLKSITRELKEVK
jgi:hypothetical protein